MKNKLNIRLTSLLKENNISKRELARQLNVSAMSISDWTNGEVQPTAENIYLLASYFEVSSDYLLGLEDEAGRKIYNNTFNNNIIDNHGTINQTIR